MFIPGEAPVPLGRVTLPLSQQAGLRPTRAGAGQVTGLLEDGGVARWQVGEGQGTLSCPEHIRE